MHRTPCLGGRAAARAAASRRGGLPAPPRGESGKSLAETVPWACYGSKCLSRTATWAPSFTRPDALLQVHAAQGAPVTGFEVHSKVDS